MGDLRTLLNLAWPVVISRLGILTMSLVDTIMVGQYATDHLAYFVLGNVIPSLIIVIIIGLLMGVQVLSSNYYGANNLPQCGKVYWHGLYYGLVIGSLALLICAYTENILLLFGQDPTISARADGVSFILGLGMPLSALYLAGAFFLEGMRKMRPVMVVMILANILNIFANYAFVYGHWGTPELGAEGASWASVCVRILQFFAITIYIFILLPDRHRFEFFKLPRLGAALGQQMRRIGYAAGLSFGIEHAAFQGLFLIAGILGAQVLASMGITINIFALAFMIGLGLATATSVMVGNAYGAGDLQGVKNAIILGLKGQAIVMAGFTIIMYFGAYQFAAYYSSDAEIIMLAGTLVAYMSIMLIFDAGQTLLAQCLRARGSPWIATFIHLFAYAGIMLPASYIAVFGFGRAEIGLIDGFVVGTFAAFGLVAAANIYLIRNQDRAPKFSSPD